MPLNDRPALRRDLQWTANVKANLSRRHSGLLDETRRCLFDLWCRVPRRTAFEDFTWEIVTSLVSCGQLRAEAQGINLTRGFFPNHLTPKAGTSLIFQALGTRAMGEVISSDSF
jgi:hypothetical protein